MYCNYNFIFRIFKGAMFFFMFVAMLGQQNIVHGSLTGHWTLDDLATGIDNQGTDGATSDLTAVGSPIGVVSGIIGSSIAFDGTDYLTTSTVGNAGDDLSGYVFSSSIWMKSTTTPGGSNLRSSFLTFTNDGSNTIHYGTGVGDGLSANDEEAFVERRNGSSTFSFSQGTGIDLLDGDWHNVSAVFKINDGGPGNATELYVDGKFVTVTTSGNISFNTTVDTITIAGLIDGSGLEDAFTGELDDAGLFDEELESDDFALINGLGQTGGISLDQLDEAQALFAAVDGTQATIGGALWEKVDSGLSGSTGDYGGTVTGGDAFINVASGSGIQQVPEPSSLMLMLSCSFLMCCFFPSQELHGE